jgi:hypothetical protein
VKNIVKRLKPVWCINLLLTGLLVAGMAFADNGTDDSLSNGGTDMPPYQMSGWFFNPTADPFPNFADPSQQWTSQDNIDQINYWLNLVAEQYGNDPSPAGDLNALTFAVTQTQAATTPEPMAASLLGGGLAFLGIYSLRRTRR